jgi:Domain of unknown function (DUF4440)
MLPRCIQRFASIILAAAALSVAQEPSHTKVNSRIMTATRQVTLFTGLETQLLRAIHKKDQAALNGLLADDFFIEMPGAEAIAGEDWVAQVMGKDFSLKLFVIREMSVADLGDSAVVKFGRIQQAAFKNKDQSGEFFVVDVWKRSGDSWKLSNRYVSKVGPVPARARSPRPTGKQ